MSKPALVNVTPAALRVGSTVKLPILRFPPAAVRSTSNEPEPPAVASMTFPIVKRPDWAWAGRAESVMAHSAAKAVNGKMAECRMKFMVSSLFALTFGPADDVGPARLTDDNISSDARVRFTEK